MVTGNVRELERVSGLRVENWLSTENWLSAEKLSASP